MMSRYGLITEQKKGAYRYFADLGSKMEVVASRTAYVDEVGRPISRSHIADVKRENTPQERETEADKAQILFGMDLGAASAEVEEEEGGGEGSKSSDAGTRTVPLGCRVFYTAEEVRSFRTLGLEPGMYTLECATSSRALS